MSFRLLEIGRAALVAGVAAVPVVAITTAVLPLHAAQNLIQNGTFEDANGDYVNLIWSYSTAASGGRPTGWTVTSGTGLMNQSNASSFNGLDGNIVGTHSLFLEWNSGAVREAYQTFTLPAPGKYKWSWNYTNWSLKYGGAQAIAELSQGETMTELARFMPKGKVKGTLNTASGITECLSDFGAEATYKLRFYLPAGGSNTGSASYYYNVIDNVSFALDTLILGENESFTYPSGLAPENVELGDGAVLTFGVNGGLDAISGSITFGTGAKIVFDLTGCAGDAYVLKTGGVVLPSGVSDVTSCIELAGTETSEYTVTTKAGGRIVVLVKNTAPYSAVWTGAGGSGAPMSAANWNCTTIDGTPCTDAVPGAATEQVTLNAAADWRSLSSLELSAFAVIDMNGFGLKLAGLSPAKIGCMAIMNSATGGEPAELRVTVAEGEDDGGDIALAGNVKLVKDGAGTLVAPVACCAGGAVVEAGVLKCGIDGVYGTVVQNADFSKTSGGYWAYTKNVSGGITDWTLSDKDHTGLFNTTHFWGKPYGSCLFFEGAGASRFAEQTVVIDKAGLYDIGFLYGPWSASSNYGVIPVTLTLSCGDETLYSATVTPTKGAKDFQEHSGSVFIGFPGEYKLKFTSGSGSGWVYCMVDNVNLALATPLRSATVGADGVFDVNGKKNFQNVAVTLDGGTLRNSGGDADDASAQLANVSVTAEGAALEFPNSYGLVGAEYGPTVLDLGGTVLPVSVASGKVFRLYNTTVRNGSLVLMGDGCLKTDKNAVTAADVSLKAGCALNMAAPLSVRDYEAAYAGTGNAGSAALNVSGTFKLVGAGFYPPVLQAGASLDLTEWEGALPLAGVSVADAASASTLTVSLDPESATTKAWARSKQQLLAWDAKPENTAFKLDSASAARYKLLADGTGLYLGLKGGFILIVR